MKIHPISDPSLWNKYMRQCRETDFQQTWEYGEGVERCAGWKPLRQLVLDDQTPVALVQTLTKTLPIVGPAARMQNGPMFFDYSKEVPPNRAMEALRCLTSYWTKEKESALHLTPCLLPEDLPSDWISNLRLYESKEPFWNSIRIDLSIEADALRRNMRRTGWREPLRKAERLGLQTVWSQSDADFDFLLTQYRQAQREKGFSWPSADLVQVLWDRAKDSFQIVWIENEERRLAGMALFTFVDTSYCLIAWNGPSSRETHAANLIFWQSILYFQQRNYRWLDLGGIDPVNLPGITEFKRGMGGQEYRWAGGAESISPAARRNFEEAERQDEIPYVIPGFASAPFQLDKLDDVQNRVESLVADFVRDLSGMNVSIDRHESLINSGLIDSLSIVSLVQTLQEAFDIEIAPFELTIENFDTPERIASFVKEKSR
ncbi:MAG: GNAT family N-acetyltransferase [Candidatus Omnitrophica bacterium]|nr:GNAT family N-acetyltransferase [Candidatus Omnitrophota bacterium]